MDATMPKVSLLVGEMRRVTEIDLALSDGGAQVTALRQVKPNKGTMASAREADPRVAEADKFA